MANRGLYALCLHFLLLLVGIGGNAQQDTSVEARLPEIRFTRKNTHINKSIKTTLDSIAIVLQSRPSHTIGIITGRNCAKGNQSWDRVSAVVNYLHRKGIDPTRWVFMYSESTDVAIIQFSMYPM
jgi:hypothetical protein